MAIKYNCPFCDHENWAEDIKNGCMRECVNCRRSSIVSGSISKESDPLYKNLTYITFAILAGIFFIAVLSDGNLSQVKSQSIAPEKASKIIPRKEAYGPPEPERIFEKKRLKETTDIIKAADGQNNLYKINSYKKALNRLGQLASDSPYFESKLMSSLTVQFQLEHDRLSELVAIEEKKQVEIKKKNAIEYKRFAKEKEIRKRKEQAELKKATRDFRKNEDKIEGNTFYTHKNLPEYVNTRSGIVPYVCYSGYFKRLRVRIQYVSSNWLFVKRVLFAIDGDNTEKKYSSFDWKRDNGSSGIWEWIDVSGDSEMLKILKKIANSKKTVIRFEGDKYRKDITIKSKDKKAIKETLKLYNGKANE